MTMLSPGSTTLALKPLCGAQKPGTKTFCVKIGPDHDGDHDNPYRGGGVTWPRTAGDKR